MSQSRKQSAIETATNTAIGFLGSWLICLMVAAQGFSPAGTATWAAVACTAWSLLRGYAVRRYFNQAKDRT